MYTKNKLCTLKTPIAICPNCGYEYYSCVSWKPDINIDNISGTKICYCGSVFKWMKETVYTTVEINNDNL